MANEPAVYAKITQVAEGFYRASERLNSSSNPVFNGSWVQHNTGDLGATVVDAVTNGDATLKSYLVLDEIGDQTPDGQVLGKVSLLKSPGTQIRTNAYGKAVALGAI